MPVVDIKLNVALTDDASQAIAAEFAEAFGASLDASCTSVLVSLHQARLFLNGSADPAAFVEIRSVTDFGIESKRHLCEIFYEILARRCAVDPSRVYMQTTRIMPEDAWNMTSCGATCVLDRIRGERSLSSTPRAVDPELFP